MAYGGSQARGQTGATAAGLHHSRSNARSESYLQPTPQLTAMLDPYPLSEAKDRNCNLMVPSWILFLCTMMGIPSLSSFYSDGRTRVKDYPFHPCHGQRTFPFQGPPRGSRLLLRHPRSSTVRALFFQGLFSAFSKGGSQTGISGHPGWGWGVLLPFGFPRAQINMGRSLNSSVPISSSDKGILI